MVVFKKFLTLSCCCCRLILVAASMFLTRIYKMAREREELLLQLVSFRPTHLRRTHGTIRHRVHFLGKRHALLRADFAIVVIFSYVVRHRLYKVILHLFFHAFRADEVSHPLLTIFGNLFRFLWIALRPLVFNLLIGQIHRDRNVMHPRFQLVVEVIFHPRIVMKEQTRHG